jgi:exopolysaccharide biosynthesis polyprenyl glycosylphosphotransferase
VPQETHSGTNSGKNSGKTSAMSSVSSSARASGAPEATSEAANPGGWLNDSPLDGRSDGPPQSSRRLRLLLVVSDLLATTGAFAAGSLVLSAAPTRSDNLRLTAWGVAITMVFIGLNRLYLARVCSLRALETAALLRANLLAGAVVALVQDRIKVVAPAWKLLFLQILAFAAVLVGRSLYRSSLRRARRVGRFMRPVVLVGTGDEAFELAKLLESEPELGYQVIGLVGDRAEALRRGFTIPVLGGVDDAVEIVRSTRATGAIIGASSLSFRDLNRVVRGLLDSGAHVQVSGGLAGIAASRLRANPIGREAAFYLEKVSLTGWEARIKRTIDIIGSSILLIPALPIIGVLAIFVKKTDGGPVFFKQNRVGLDNQEFKILKIRTMIVNAEAKLAELQAGNERSGPLFKMTNDPRLTRIGRFMDATSLNELPQLINVLKGEMSLVGPRPALPKEVAKFDERLLIRHRVRPGITGLWQVESRDSPSFADYERCDVFYVENWSVQLDLAILLQTVGEVVRRAAGKKAVEPPSPVSAAATLPPTG